MIKSICTLLFFMTVIACKEKGPTEKLYHVRTDIRFGSRFFSMYLSEDGSAYVVKGTGSYNTEELKIESSDTSDVFRLDSVKMFFEDLNRIKENPILGASRLDAPRAEIYYDHKKIYDTYKWDEGFWDLFRPIMHQIPKGFNPFLAEDRPFD